MRILFLAIVGLLAALPATAAERTATFSVPGMTCPLCPITVTTAIKKLDGIVTVSADVNAKTATVIFDDTRTSAEAIAEASKNAGYPAGLVNKQ